MKYQEMIDAVRDAETTVEYGDRAVRRLLPLLAGRLRQCGAVPEDLAALKRELRDFNLHTKSWKP